MLEAINDFVLTIADPLLGWMLLLPRDVALIVVALLTALVLTLVRIVTTDQSYLAQCKADKKQLKTLMREARRRKDKDALQRHRKTLGQIGGRQMLAEGWPLLASIVPIALLATWAFARLAFLPIAPGEVVTVNAYFPMPRIGERIHMLPEEGLAAEDGWLQRIRPVKEGDFAMGIYDAMASWDVRPELREEPYELEIRFGGDTLEMPLVADGQRYAPPIKFVDDPRVEALTVDLTEYRPFFGVVPGVPMLMLQPWIVGYLLIVLPLAFVLKPVLRVQ